MPATRKTTARKTTAPKYPAGRYAIQRVYGPNTHTGNPRRVTLPTHIASGKTYGFDEGYMGTGAVPSAIRRNGVEHPGVYVSASEYARLRKAYAAS